MQYSRVKAAYAEKENQVKALFQAKGLTLSSSQVFIRIFKQEKLLEVWALHGGRFRLLQNYPICASSGTLGPKRQMGDKQVPEGFYYIDRFNPESNFYPSLGINYPNTADQYRAGRANPGDNIFIHGHKQLPLVQIGSRGQYRLAQSVFPNQSRN